MKLVRLAPALGALAASLAAPADVRAQAFSLNEIGSCAVGRAGGTTGAPCQDASVIYWNPAAATRLPGVSIYGGVAGIGVDGSFRQDVLNREFPGDIPWEFPPHLFATWNVRPRLSLGIGAYVPYGLTSQWEENFPGRFSAKMASLQSIYVQPNIAYELVPGRLAIGGGPVIAHSTVELEQALDLSTQRTSATGPTFGQLGIPLRTEFARANVEADDIAYGFNLGVHATPTPAVQLGVRYLSEIEFEYEGDVNFRQVSTGLVLAANNPLGFPAGTPVDTLVQGQFQTGGALVTQDVGSRIAHPQQFQAGIGFTALPNTLFAVDAVWTGWSSFDVLPFEFKGPAAGSSRELLEEYEDTWGVRASGEYAFQNAFAGWSARAGFGWAQTPAPDVTVTPLLPDSDRYNYTLGVTIPLAERWSVDAAYWRVQTTGRRGRIVERDDPTLTAAQLNEGWYELSANVLSFSVKARF
ncbi:MAG TPA: outer membrane protein transport protein [Gemmatimonadaceae bacterium]|nr:outer membrane protein transport protein [Gemmatimonadaceae bacterium]